MDMDCIIHARLCHLCPALWPLLQIHPERTAGSKHISLSSTSHPGTHALLLLNWHLWPGAQILLSHSLSSLNELCICQIHISLVHVNTGCPLGAVASKIQRPAAPEPPYAAGSCALQHIHGIYLRGCFHVAPPVTVWEPAGSQPQDCCCRDRPSLRSHRWAAPRSAALTPLGQASSF